MNIEELAKSYNISITKVQRLYRDGWLRGVSNSNVEIRKMKQYLMNKRPLSTAMCISLLRDNSLLEELGGVMQKAVVQLSHIGNPDDGALPADKWGDIVGASINDIDSLNSIADWLLQAIPSSGCNYHYIAVRLLWNVPQERLAQVYSRIPRCLINVRAIPRLAGCSDRADGPTKFYRPETKNFDL